MCPPLLLLSVPAGAWSLLGTSWAWQGHAIQDPFHLGLDSFPASVGEPADVEAAVEGALDSWSSTGRDLVLPYGGTIEDAEREADGFVEIAYGGHETGGTLAYASIWAWKDGGMYDCDITVLESNDYGWIDWSADPAGPGGAVDLEAVLLHEMGHCSGLGHSTSKSAVMYAYYQGYRNLSSDDRAGIAALYGEACEDADADGVSACDGDCADHDPAVFPGSGEVCDGGDDDCDGVVDGDEEITVVIGESSRLQATEWVSVGNVFWVSSNTRLVSWRQRFSTYEGARLVWTVRVADDPAGPWTLVRSARALALDANWQDSPKLDIPLEAGRYWSVSLGALSSSVRFGFDSTPDLAPQGPLTPIGFVYGRALGDQDEQPPDDGYLISQELGVLDLPDADGDGSTVLCGDCAPSDPTVYPGAMEACNGVDDDCDGEVDEDFASDADGDGVYDCLDPCPTDPTDACDDTGPDDPVDTADDSGHGDDGDGRDVATCGCGSRRAVGVASPLLLALAALGLRRRPR
ncbi:MAG: matrixin family metalloprotease [Deltaproteobacteria bacterium]|nr:matrixin family metalloprotease [Deltaproteobacteria bacterium]